MRFGPAPLDRRIVVVPTVASAPDCNGGLDHLAWEHADELDGFQVRINGRTPDVDTRVRLLSDGQNLHVAFICEEPELQKAIEQGRDDDSGKGGRGDCVIVCIDPGLTRTRAFTFNLYLSGRCEGDLPQEGWAGAVAMGDGAWVGQFMLPLKTLCVDPADGDAWGIALARSRSGSKHYPQVNSWSPSDLKVSNPRDFGLLIFRGGLDERDALARGVAIRDRMQAVVDAEDWRACASLGPSHGEDGLPVEQGAMWTLPVGTAKVVRADVERIVRGRVPFTWQRFDEPQLRELRERYALDRIVAGAADDFEEAIRLQQWGIDHIPFGRPAHSDYNALRLLDDAAQGRTFLCTHFSYVFMQLCLAMGIPARKLTTIGHASDEFWSNRWRKWITVECTRGHYFEMNGVPLSALEVHDEVVRNMGVDMDYSRGTDRAIRKVNMERDADDKLADAQERYQFVGALMRNDILSVGLDDENFRFLWWRDDHNRDLDAIDIWSGRAPYRFRHEPEEGWEPIYVPTEDPADLYFTLNQTELHASPAPDGIRIVTSTVTPWFARLEARIDGGDWQRAAPTLKWSMHKGQNSIEVRPINAFRRAGIVSALTVEMM